METVQYRLNDEFKPRLYQQTIFFTSIEKNTLVVLPTGLGKTLIAAMLAIYKLNENPDKKIVFLAPTKPLVAQHNMLLSQLRGTKTIPQALEIYATTASIIPRRKAARIPLS